MVFVVDPTQWRLQGVVFTKLKTAPRRENAMPHDNDACPLGRGQTRISGVGALEQTPPQPTRKSPGPEMTGVMTHSSQALGHHSRNNTILQNDAT